MGAVIESAEKTGLRIFLGVTPAQLAELRKGKPVIVKSLRVPGDTLNPKAELFALSASGNVPIRVVREVPDGATYRSLEIEKLS